MHKALTHLLLCLLITELAYSQTENDIDLPVPVFVNTQFESEMNIRVREGEYYIRHADLNSILQKHFENPTIESRADFYDLSKLSIAGGTFKFNEAELSLNITVTAEARKKNVLSIYQKPYASRNNSFLKPSAFSGYLNLRGSSTFNTGTDDNQNSVDFEPVFNIHSFVLENRLTYQDSSEENWQLIEQRLIKDDEENAYRYTIGDVSYSTAGFQGFEELTGLSFSKQFSIHPYKITNPVGRQSFLLKQRSKVRLKLNGRLIREFILPAGTHNINDLPLARGINNISIEIEDQFGRIETIYFSQLSENELLDEGLHEFTYNAGFLSEIDGFNRTVDGSQPRYSLFHRLGLKNENTIGLNYQGTNKFWMTGMEFLTGTSFGFWGLDLAASEGEGLPLDYAYRVRYRLTWPSKLNSFPWSWSWSFEQSGQEFANLANTSPNNSRIWQFETDISIPSPFSGLRLATGYSYTKNRNSEDRKTVSLLGSFFGFRNHQFTGDYSYIQDQFADEHRFFATWTWSGFDVKNYSISTYDSTDDSLDLEYHQTLYPQVGQVDLTAASRNSRTQNSLSASADYFDQNFLVLSEYEHFYKNENSEIEGIAQFTAGTAIAFAGSQWGFSRPIVDSFALISAKPHLSGQRIPVNSQGPFTEAEIGNRSMAVLANLTSYHFQPVFLDSSNLAEGFSLEKENLVLRPTLRSGFDLVVGTDATVFLSGRFIDDKDRSLGLKTAQVIPKNNKSDGSSKILFTNRKGQFYVEGLTAGQWQIVFDDPNLNLFEFSVESEKTGEVNLGTIKIREKF